MSPCKTPPKSASNTAQHAGNGLRNSSETASKRLVLEVQALSPGAQGLLRPCEDIGDGLLTRRCRISLDSRDISCNNLSKPYKHPVKHLQNLKRDSKSF